jgi:uncharacterized protein with HEPN domain
VKDDLKYLLHIRECIGRVEEDIAGGRDAFMASHTVQDAVLRNLQVIAESTKRLSEDLRTRQPDIDWGGIAGFRNLLVHDYLGVDLAVVWQVVIADVPKLKTAILRCLG